MVRSLEVVPDLTPTEAVAEVKRLWGEAACAYKAPKHCVVACAGKANGTGRTFREAFEDAERRRVWRALATAFGIVGVAAVREENKRQGELAIAQCPKDAYRKGCELATMAVVEWCNARHEPLAIGREWPGWFSIERYHEARRSGMTANNSYAAVRDGKCNVGVGPGWGVRPIGSPYHEALRIMCAAYERGRPGGGR